MGVFDALKDRLNQEEKSRDGAGMEKDPGVTRIFFATDLHGSTVCWKKFINSADFYDADVLILGGDTTGKAIFPIIDEGNRYRYTRGDKEKTIESDSELEDTLENLENRGYYTYVLDQEEYEKLQHSENSQQLQDEIFEDEMKNRIEEWTDLADERIDDVPIYVCPGNDDPLFIDEVWEDSETVDLVEGEVTTIDENYEMVSSGWTQPTPWDTDREFENDQKLERHLEEIIAQSDDATQTIFNFHEPPYDSGLDEAPELDDDLRPKFGAQSTEPVGSKAVRKMIETYQPPLSLHGHIHESRGEATIGDTPAVNPGSVYSEGSLQGAVIDLKPDEVDVVGLVRG